MIFISDKLKNLKPEKQKRILNAALREFAEKGYDQASTNQIVEKAKIGKGTLFYYFNSKKELYNYIIKYGLNFVTEEYLDKINIEQSDFIERLKKVSKTKMKAYKKNPHVFNFLGSLYLNKDNVNLSNKLISRIEKKKQQSSSMIFKNIDTSLFRKDIPHDLIIKLIHWSIEGYEKELIEDLKDKNLTSINFDPYWDEFHDFLDTLKKIFYRQKED